MNRHICSLLEGNEIFRNNFGQNGNPGYIDVQKPNTAIFSCSDSRVPSEKIFNLGKGQLFVIREAGHVLSLNSTASLEYAVKVIGIKQLIILGHTKCGAIKAALSGKDLGSYSLNMLAKKIRENLSHYKNMDYLNENLTDDLTLFNSKVTLINLIRNSEIIREKYENKELHVYYGIYNIKNGKVNLFDLN
jgi:carbonic anhydrase